MRRAILLLIATFIVLLAGGIGTALAEPQNTQTGQNEIPIIATCDNGETYELIVVAEGQSLKPVSSEHLVVLRSTFNLFDAKTRKFIDTIVFDKGQKTGLEGDLVQCEGTVKTTLFKIGEVRIEFTFEALVT